jgi:hypothetical protein
MLGDKKVFREGRKKNEVRQQKNLTPNPTMYVKVSHSMAGGPQSCDL